MLNFLLLSQLGPFHIPIFLKNGNRRKNSFPFSITDTKDLVDPLPITGGNNKTLDYQVWPWSSVVLHQHSIIIALFPFYDLLNVLSLNIFHDFILAK